MIEDFPSESKLWPPATLDFVRLSTHSAKFSSSDLLSSFHALAQEYQVPGFLFYFIWYLLK